jgi:transposase-like protein
VVVDSRRGVQRSGLSQRRYFAQQRLTEKTFMRWRRVLTDAKALQAKAELLREKQRERRRKRHIRLSSDMRSKAVQAFWAMHVEAMTWCGMSAQSYAKAHRLSLHSLKRWRGLLDAGEVQIDWRAHLHPSALPQISTGASSAAKESGVESGLTDAANADPPSDGRSNRRRFSDEEKFAIVRESEQPGARAAVVCRRHGIVTSMLFRWRVQFGFGKTPRPKLATVMLLEGQSTASSVPLVLHELLQPLDGTMTVQLGDGRRVLHRSIATRMPCADM